MGEAIRIDRERAHGMEALSACFAAAMSGQAGTFAEREARALALGNELVRRWIEAELTAVAGTFGDDVVVDEHTYRRCGDGTVRYHTLCGAVAVRCGLYRQVGVHNGPTVVPLELRADLWEQATPALAFSVTQGFAAGPLRGYEREMTAAHREVPSRSTLERIGKRVGRTLEATVDESAAELRAAEPDVAGVCAISVGFDRTTVPMAEAIPGAPVPEPRLRRRPAPVTVAYRMAYAGTVSLHDRDGRVLVTKYFGATAAEGPAAIVDRIAAELHHQRARYGVGISAIQDGAPELWGLIDRLTTVHGLTIDARVTDRDHVDERLAEVCELVTGFPVAARALYDAWRYQLDHSDAAIDRIIQHLDALTRHSAFGAVEGEPPPTFWRRRGVRGLRASTQAQVNGHLEYFRRHRRRIRYASRRRDGLPIGSGPTEGACKSLVTARCKGSGQRWFESGVAPCLSVRALHLGDRLRPAFERIGERRRATLAAA